MLYDLTIHTDGGSRGNPGPSAWGVVFDLTNRETALCQRTNFAGCLGIQTNNYAEHYAMNAALKRAFTLSDLSTIQVYADSKLIVNHVNGTWNVHHPELERLCLESQAAVSILIDRGIPVTISHVRREFNQDADALCNLALDGKEI